LHNATVLCKNKKIHTIGYDVDVPSEPEVLDVTGHRVYPGLVAIQRRSASSAAAVTSRTRSTRTTAT
jgi:dihydroorotase-like cyclic amidohydrolase